MRSRASSALLAVGATLLIVAPPTQAHRADRSSDEPTVVRAPGYAPLSYAAPQPGTYELPVLGDAADGSVLTAAGERRRLHDLLGGKISILSFIYTSCPDVDGCPLATFVLGALQRRLAERAELRDRVRLLTLSFDPQHDTPERMRAYGEKVAGRSLEWRFLTTGSAKDLEPILAAYDQSVIAAYDEQGRSTGTFSHVLRVFLIDAERRIRNIYSTSFLHADTLASDVETLLLESVSGAAAEGAPAAAGDGAPAAAADGPPTAAGAPEAGASLEDLVRRVPLGLPELEETVRRETTAARIALGRKLFFDRRLSRNETFSCAMCHVPGQGFTSNEMATAVGIEGRSLKRNAPTLLNVAYAAPLFHDGREPTLEEQIWGPMLSPIEMGNDSPAAVARKIGSLADYDGLFEGAFAGQSASKDTIAAALAAYERALLAADSPFDRWRYGGRADALGDDARRGFELFTGKAGCVHCHTIGEDHALFTDNSFHDTGIGYLRAGRSVPEKTRVRLAPDVYVEVEREIIEAASEAAVRDDGRAEATGDAADRWKYRTPTLRNVALTAPYMHDGSLATLADVVEHYDRGGIAHELLDPAIHELGLDAREKADLVAFLESVTGSTVNALVADAAGAPIGDP